jgi:phage terminase small subunit
MSKPTELHKIEGTYRPDRHSTDIKAPMMVRMPKPPEGMSEAAAVWWRKKVLDLKEMGLLVRSDLELLAVYCNLLADIDDARRNLNNSLTLEVRAKWTKLHNDALKYAYQLNTALGQNPLSRTKIRVEKQGDPNPFDDI